MGGGVWGLSPRAGLLCPFGSAPQHLVSRGRLMFFGFQETTYKKEERNTASSIAAAGLEASVR